MADISVIKLPNGNSYNFKDATARSSISNLYTAVTGTLAAGATSLTLSSSKITTSSTIDVYSSVFGVCPTAMTVSTGSVTMTFEAQTSSVDIKVIIF